MPRMIWLVLALSVTACTSAEEKARQREQAMIEQARADSAAEADFVADSVALASSISLDSVVELRVRNVTARDEDGDEYTEQRHEAVNHFGLVCHVEEARYRQLVRGDTLRCQWGPEL